MVSTDSVFIDDRHVFRHRQDPYCLYFKTGGRVFRLTPWKADFLLEYRMNRQWRPMRHMDFVLVHPGNDISFRKILTRFLASIPREIREHAAQFEYLQLQVLRLLRAVPNGLDLARDVPALFWLLAGRAGSADLGFPRAADLLRGGRKHLIKALLGPDCLLSVNFFRKFEISRFNRDSFLFINNLAHSFPRCRSILHCARIPVDLVADVRPLDIFQTPLFQQTMASKDPEAIQKVRIMFSDVREMVLTWESDTLLEQLFNCSRLERLEALHDRVTRRMMDDHPGELESLVDVYGQVFPESPLCGNNIVEPVRTVDDLYAEGDEMNHCVFSYVNRIFQEKSFIYKVMFPERGTLELDAGLNIAQFELKNNEAPSKESWKAVEQWRQEALMVRKAEEEMRGFD